MATNIIDAMSLLRERERGSTWKDGGKRHPSDPTWTAFIEIDGQLMTMRWHRQFVFAILDTFHDFGILSRCVSSLMVPNYGLFASLNLWHLNHWTLIKQCFETPRFAHFLHFQNRSSGKTSFEDNDRHMNVWNLSSLIDHVLLQYLTDAHRLTNSNVIPTTLIDLNPFSEFYNCKNCSSD